MTASVTGPTSRTKTDVAYRYEALLLEFTTLCNRLAVARASQRQKDSTNNRIDVADCLGQIDTVLDMYLDTVRFQLSDTTPGQPAARFSCTGGTSG